MAVTYERERSIPGYPVVDRTDEQLDDIALRLVALHTASEGVAECCRGCGHRFPCQKVRWAWEWQKMRRRRRLRGWWS